MTFQIFLSAIIPCSDNILISGDFNIHTCLSSRPLVKEFNHLLESFGLSQCVVGPTHERGYTLDLLLTLGFSVGSVQTADTLFSDHKTVLFNPTFSYNGQANDGSVAVESRVLSSSTASNFSGAFDILPLKSLMESPFFLIWDLRSWLSSLTLRVLIF